MRGRTTAVATIVVAAALAVAAFTILSVLRHSLISNLDDTARLRTRDVAALARRGPLPDPLPVIGEETALVQVIDRTGTVAASSENLRGEPAIGPFRSEPGPAPVRTSSRLPIGDGTRFRIATLSVRTSDGSFTIYVAVSLGSTDHTMDVVTTALAIGFPLLLAVVAITTWFVVSRALGPVESIRRHVAEISARDSGQRVPEPPVEDEIGRLARTMNEMLARLDESTRHERRFVDDASHELRTPLTVILANLELAIRSDDPTEQQLGAAEAQHEGLRMQRLLSDLLLLARADSGALPFDPVPVDLAALVHAEADPRDGGVPIDTTQVHPASVLADTTQINQVLRNLFDNAQRYARHAVTVEVRQRDHDAELLITDDGPGIPPRDRERIFDRFVRLDEGRSRDAGGTGLGLAICREIVERHGGTITIADSDRGARFIVRLPSPPGGH